MKSVFIINSEIYEKYQRYAYFFNWFEDHRDVSLCIWNKYASDRADIDEMVPQLFETVKNVAEWNAYIIDEPFFSADYIEDDFVNMTQCSINPYERARHSNEYDIEKDPLLRLTYFLGGRGVEELEYIYSYAFRAVRPTQIILLTPRIFENLEMQKQFLRSEIEERYRKATENPSELLKVKDLPSLNYSDFWSRYDYPPNCRFMVFDMPDTLSVKYEDSWFLFWMAVMTVALNRYNSSELGAYKLYRLGIDISDGNFESYINKFYTALYTACEVSEKEIESEIAAIKLAMADTTCHHPADCAPVYVNFPDTDFSKFDLKPSWFGITKDKPRLDTDVFEDYRREAGTEAYRLFKAIARGKNEAVDSMNRTFAVDLPLLKNQRLSRYDVEDITDRLNASEIEMLGMKTGTAASRAVFDANERKAAKKFKKAMSPRVFTRTYLMLMLMGVLVCLMGFIPFMISSASFNITSFLVSLLISLASCAIIGAVSFLALKLLRMKFGESISNYNDDVVSNLETVKANSKIQERYLSALLNYMEKYQMLISGRVEENRMKHLDELTRIRATYEDAIEQCKSIAGLCHIKLSADPENNYDNTIFVPGKKIYLHEDVDVLRIPLNDAPDRLTPPFTFVESLKLSEEVIYESPLYYSADEDDPAKGATE